MPAAVDLDGWRELLELSRDELLERLGAGASDVHSGVKYQGLQSVDRVHVPAAHPGHFYLRGDRVEMLYVGEDALAGVDAAELERRLGGPGELMRSRAGRRSRMHVYPEQGTAFAEEEGQVQILELFAPTTLQGYKDRIFAEPGRFRR